MEMNPLQLHLLTPCDVQRALAERLRAIRITAGLKQSTLAARAGISLATLRLFEQRGEISLKRLLKICHALGRLEEFDHLFQPPPAATMAELESRFSTPTRRRGVR